MKPERTNETLTRAKFDEPLSTIDLWLLDREKHAIRRINRQGQVLKKYQKLSHPQFLHFTEHELLITDAKLGVIKLTIDNFDVLKIWKKSLNLKFPRSAIPITNQRILIADRHQLLEVNHDSEILWSLKDKSLNPHFASFISTERLLIVETHQHVVREIDLEGNTHWQYGHHRVFGKKVGHLFLPEFAQRTDRGTTMIAK